jgi:hypothetical protein
MCRPILITRRWFIHSAAAATSLVIVGCQSTPPRRSSKTQSLDQSQASAPITNTDACANRLHDISGGLLLYYAVNHRLPANLDELRQLPGFVPTDFVCPVSKKPYVYNPIGVQTLGQPERIILYDPAPSHSGFRWAVTFIEPQRETDPPITKVIGLPESHFNLRPPR